MRWKNSLKDTNYQKLIQEEINRNNSTLVKVYSNKETSGYRQIHWWILPTFKEEILTIPHKLFWKRGEGNIFQLTFWGQHYSDNKARKIKENKTTFLMNIDIKTYNKILANQIHQYIRWITIWLSGDYPRNARWVQHLKLN